MIEVTRLLAEHLQGLRPRPKRLWVGLSGGVDSMLMLYCAHLWLQQEVSSLDDLSAAELAAIHIHHGVADEADQWAAHCKTCCSQWQIPLQIVKVQPVGQTGRGLEAELRALRYAAFARYVRSDDVLLLAHHRDDQVETLLLRLFRGTGIKGLRGMQSLQCQEGMRVMRPWLSLPKSELVAQANQFELSWVEDASNQDTRFSRNAIRQQILPLIRQHWPGVDQPLVRIAEQLSDPVQLPASVLALLSRHSVSLQAVWVLPAEQQRQFIYQWLQAQVGQAPSYRLVMAVVEQVITASELADPVVKWQGGAVRRYRDSLCWVCDAQVLDQSTSLISCPNSLDLIWVRQGIRVELPLEAMSCRYRQGGERVWMPGVGHQPLKQFFQTKGVPPWLRPIWPLIYCDDTLVMLPHLWVHVDYQVQQDQPGWQIACRDPRVLQWLAW